MAGTEDIRAEIETAANLAAEGGRQGTSALRATNNSGETLPGMSRALLAQVENISTEPLRKLSVLTRQHVAGAAAKMAQGAGILARLDEESHSDRLGTASYHIADAAERLHDGKASDRSAASEMLHSLEYKASEADTLLAQLQAKLGELATVAAQFESNFIETEVRSSLELAGAQIDAYSSNNGIEVKLPKVMQ